jgi:hypothetical protein
MRLIIGLMFWAIFLTLTISMLVHLYQEPSNDFVNATGLVIAMFCCLIGLSTKK